MMDRIIARGRAGPALPIAAIDAAHPEPEPTLPDAICCALRRAPDLLGVAAAVTYTQLGLHEPARGARASGGSDPRA